MALATTLIRRFHSPKSINTVLWRTMSSETNDVILESSGNKGIITLNRPKALNALNLSMIRKIYPQLQKWEADPEIKMVLIKGSGDKAFCAGGDIRAVAEAWKKGESLTKDFFREEYLLNNLIGTLQIPYVALIHGITMGGGVGLSVHGAYRVATEKTVFAMPEATIGFFPDVGGSFFLPRLPGKLGLYLALTGFRLVGRDLTETGIATHFVSSGKLKDLEQDLMKITNPTLQNVDKILQRYVYQCEKDHVKTFSLKQEKGKIDTLFNAESLEAIMQNLNKDGSEWAKKQIDTLNKQSPTSLKVAFQQLKEGAKLTLQEALKMEFRLSQKFMANKDFYEGVRAVLIDKDNNPKWNPCTIQEVTNEKLNEYFKELPSDQELPL